MSEYMQLTIFLSFGSGQTRSGTEVIKVGVRQVRDPYRPVAIKCAYLFRCILIDGHPQVHMHITHVYHPSRF